MEKILFAQFVKVNEATGEFAGIAAEEIPDAAGEIFDYEASKPLIKAWSDDSFEHSNGKSYGNLRAMHDPKKAAGLLTGITFNDELKRVEVAGKVIDPEELQKLAAGVYTGLSFGGSYAWRKAEGVHIRYAAKPVELSLADKPCVPTARFTLVKADGSQVAQAFQPVAKVAAREDVNPEEGEKKYGDVKFADEKNKKYPIDTEKHIRAAWNYINKEKNAAKYCSEDLASIKRKIVAAWKEKIDKEGPPSAEKEKSEKLAKGLYTVSWFAQLMETLAEMAVSIDWEAATEMDESPLPGQFKEWLSQGAEILKALAAEEVDELLADLSKAETGRPSGSPLRKAGARHSKEDQERVQQIHDHAAALGADCPGAEKAVASEMHKVLTARTAELVNLQNRTAELEAEAAKATTEKTALAAEVEKLKAEPAAPKGAVKAIDKTRDGQLGNPGEAPEPKTPLEAAKLAMEKPTLIRAGRFLD